MRTEQQTKCFVPLQELRVMLTPYNWFKPPITDRSKAIVLLWLSVTCFGVRVSVPFHLTCVHIIFSSDSVAE